MSKNLKGTKTEQNLMAAFAGESQARNKYTYFASKAKKDGYEQIAAIFEETANNEKEHAKMWFKELNGGDIPSTVENLEAAADGENYEWQQFFLRGGYYYESKFAGNRQYFGLGAGFSLNVIKIDASYMIATAQNSPLDQTLRFTLSFDLDGIKNLFGRN